VIVGRRGGNITGVTSLRLYGKKISSVRCETNSDCDDEKIDTRFGLIKNPEDHAKFQYFMPF
jgi:hypothetical protein